MNVHSNFLDPEEGKKLLGKSWEDSTDISACLVECAQRLHARGFIAATDGNISVRMSDEEIWITPTDCMKAFAQPDDMAVINIRNEIEKGRASSERLIHLMIYKHVTAARAVIFAHPPVSLALALAHPDWKHVPNDILPSVILSAGSIPILPYSQSGTEPSATELIAQINSSRLLILSRQGILSWGETLDEAYLGVERLEQTCVVISHALALGKPARLSKEEISNLESARKLSGEKTT